MRPSTTKLSKMLVEFGAATNTFSVTDVCENKALMAEGFSMSNETYGTDSCLYIGCPDHETRKELEKFLRARCNVSTVNRRYSPKSSCTEVGVTYFKGWHWDE